MAAPAGRPREQGSREKDRAIDAALRLLRDELHARAYDHHSHGRTEAAQALWSVVESLDTILTETTRSDP